MSGYNGEPDKMEPTWQPADEGVFNNRDSFITRKLHNDSIHDPSSKKRAVERLADLAANYNSVEAAANLALFANLDLNDRVFREGIINRSLQSEEVDSRKLELQELALSIKDEDLFGYIAIAGILGYYPPEKLDEACQKLDTEG